MDADGLTPRERAVVEAASSGASTQSIADELFVSPRTVESHLASIYRKLGVTSRAQLVAATHEATTAARPGDDEYSGFAAPSRPALPAFGTPPTHFVGRERERALIAEAFGRATGGTRSVFLVGGEPGVGKTALLAEGARAARDLGATVLLGSCDRDFAVPFQPFTEALRPLLVDPEIDPGAATGPGGGALAAVIAELTDRLPPTPRGLDETAGPGLVADAIIETIIRRAQAAPVMLVLEDLHWADHATIGALRRLIATTRSDRLAVVCSFRDTDLTRPHPLPGLLADLWRESDVTRVDLAGFELRETAEMAERLVGSRASAAAVDRLHAKTQGNPFFLTQMLGHGVDAESVPAGLRAVIMDRVERLAPHAVDVLRVAAVTGVEFELEVLDLALGRPFRPTNDLGNLAVLERAVAAGLLVEPPGTAGRFRFVHELVRDALADSIGPTRAADIHVAVADALSSVHAAELGPYLALLANHYAQSTRPVDRLRAGELAVEAARQSAYRASPEDVIHLVAEALAALPDGRAADQLRLELLRILAEVHRGRLDAGAHREATLEAVAVGRRLDGPMGVARALDSHRLAPRLGTVDETILALAEGAIDELGEAGGAVSVRLRAFTAYQRAIGGAGWAIADRARRAVTEARSLGDPDTLAHALFSLAGSLLGGPDLDEQLAVARELVALSDEVPQPLVPVDGRRFLGVALLAGGDRAGFEAELVAMRDAAARFQLQLLRAMSTSWESLLALLDGDLLAAETLVARTLSEAGDDPNFLLGWFAQMCALRVEQDRAEEILSLLDGTLADHADLVAMQCLAISVFAALGDHARATALLRPLMESGFDDLPRDWLLAGAAAMLAPAVAELGSATACHDLASLLLPYSGQLLVLGSGTLVVDTADHAIGILLASTGELDRGERHLEAGVELAVSVASPTLVGQAQLDLALVLRLRSDDHGARRLARRAAAEAARHDLPRLRRQIRSHFADGE